MDKISTCARNSVTCFPNYFLVPTLGIMVDLGLCGGFLIIFCSVECVPFPELFIHLAHYPCFVSLCFGNLGGWVLRRQYSNMERD